MQHRVPRFVLLALLGGLVPTLAPAQDDGQGVEERRAPDLDAARASLAAFAEGLEESRFLVADFEQTRETFLFGKPIVSTGRLWLRKEPECLRMDVLEPKKAVIRSDATSHLTWYEGKPKAERLVFERNVTAATLVRLLTGEVEDLGEGFEITGFAAGRFVTQVELVPRDEALRRELSRIQLAFGTEDSVPRSLEYENAEKETVRIELSATALRKELDDAERVFEDPLPEGVEVVTRRIS